MLALFIILYFGGLVAIFVFVADFIAFTFGFRQVFHVLCLLGDYSRKVQYTKIP